MATKCHKVDGIDRIQGGEIVPETGLITGLFPSRPVVLMVVSVVRNNSTTNLLLLSGMQNIAMMASVTYLSTHT